MQAQLEKLFEAHVAHELKQWRGKALNKRLDQDITAFADWAETIRIGQLSDPQRLSALARRRVLEAELPDALIEMIGNIAKHLIALPINGQTRLGEVVDDALFAKGIDLAVELRSIREEIIRGSLHSPLFALMVTDILYHGIRDYVVGENLLSQKLPGVSSLLSRGAGALNKRVPQLEARIEKGVRGFIDSNMQSTVAQSEVFLKKAMTDERIRELATEIWHVLRKSPLSISEFLGDAEVEAVLVFSHEFWLKLRQTDYLRELIDSGLQAFFDRYAALSLAQLLQDIGVDRATLRSEARELMPALIALVDESGFLEAQIRRRLEGFYKSKAASSALG